MNRELQVDPEQVAWRAFARDLPGLYEKYPEQWAAYKGEQVIAVGKRRYELYLELLASGLQKEEFFIFGITAIEFEIRDPYILGDD